MNAYARTDIGEHIPTSMPVPRVNKQQFLALRKLKERPSIHDMVEPIFLQLIEDEKFLSFLDATSDAEAIEGSKVADNLEAARMVRDLAKEQDSPLARKNLTAISHSVTIVANRYGIGRKQRLNKARGLTN